MRVKICGIQNIEELNIAVEAGADAIGFQVGQLYASKSFILPSTARRLVEKLPVWVTPVLVTHNIMADEILELVSHSGISTVQITRNCSLAEITKLRDKLTPSGKIIYTDYLHHLIDDMILAEIIPLIDAINLDCYNTAPELVGIEDCEKSYLWEDAVAYVKNSLIPVIICGRLDEHSVAEAIAKIHPFGVDGCTKLKSAEGVLNIDRATQFVWNSKQEFFNFKRRVLNA